MLTIGLIILTMANFLIQGQDEASEMRNMERRTYTEKYDEHFSKYSKRYFGVGFDWHWFKAQAIAESGLNEAARSWCHAKGLMQLIPTTFAEISKRHGIENDIHDPRWNIAAGIAYDSELWEKFEYVDLDIWNQISFMFGAYNAGYGNIWKVQKICRENMLNEKRWENVKRCASRLGRWRHQETMAYLGRILDVKRELGE